jgi:hypothetical protein
LRKVVFGSSVARFSTTTDKASDACLVRWKALFASAAQATMMVIIMAPVSAVSSAPIECSRFKTQRLFAEWRQIKAIMLMKHLTRGVSPGHGSELREFFRLRAQVPSAAR